MDLATPEIDEEDDIFPSKGQPHTPEESPPSSPLSEEVYYYYYLTINLFIALV